MSNPYLAHSLPGVDPGSWQTLDAHLRGVARRAEEFGAAFGCGKWARLAGLWHDLGKSCQSYQDYLRASAVDDSHWPELSGNTDHSTAGALHAVERLGLPGHMLAFAIAGHHGGLQDAYSEGTCLRGRLEKPTPSWDRALMDQHEEPVPELPAFLERIRTAKGSGSRDTGFAFALFTRMLFSCLVDADYLDTEAFLAPEQAARRSAWSEDVIARMDEALTAHVASLKGAGAALGQARARVRAACLSSLASEPGLFSLTAPAGSGKTLSSLAFALGHAKHNGLDRVIYVTPLTGVTDDKADLFRQVTRGIQPSPVVEYHGDLDVGGETGSSRLASENWDAPLVVTTSPQFYESLFASRGSSCRKLHNLSRSVVVIDEVQTLPTGMLAPCLRALAELARSYNSTVLLCTATQPAIHNRDGFSIGLKEVREIVPEPRRLYDELRRVAATDLGQRGDQQIARRLLEHHSALCVVNTREHARALSAALGEDGAHLHLSGGMCPAHRGEVLDAIRERLDLGLPCRVVSTPFIEVGVDIDFPVVYRALAGADALALAAGRCNREGRAERGELFIFRSGRTRAGEYFRQTTAAAEQTLARHTDPLSLEALDHYFKLLYEEAARTSGGDHKRVLYKFHIVQDPKTPYLFSFATAAREFSLLENAGRPVIIPWGEDGEILCKELRDPNTEPGMELLRHLQRYTVLAPPSAWKRHVERGEIELVKDHYPVLVSPGRHYSGKIGLAMDGE